MVDIMYSYVKYKEKAPINNDTTNIHIYAIIYKLKMELYKQPSIRSKSEHSSYK